MRVLIAPDKFKGTLTAKQAAAAMAEGVRRVWPDAEIVTCPMSDGGDGFVEIMCEAQDGRRITRTVCGPLPGMRVDAAMGLLGDDAVIEVASAAGLVLVPEDQRNPLNTTSFGVGELLRFAVGMDCRQALLGLGGSATCDAGLGALQALGCPITLDDGSVHTADDPPLCGRHLARVTNVGRPGMADGLRVGLFCDVTNPLFGPNGSAHVFGPQKGATPPQVEQLDAGLRHFASVIGGDPSIPGAGAAGGIGFGLAAALPVEPTAGLTLLAEMNGFFDEPAWADVVLTGEGRYDATSRAGKVVGFVAEMTREHNGCPCLAFCGSAASVGDETCEVISLAERVGEQAAMSEPARHLADAVADHLRTLRQ
ncbi:MAG: glycerate kinase [Planctomycetota bacterium]